jgi:carbonic anhydrase
MSDRNKTRPTLPPGLAMRLAMRSALISALGLVMAGSAWASDAHGGGHEAPKAAKPAAKEPKESKEPKEIVESKDEGKPEPREAKGANVSMGELRDLIDQKIAEVRTKRAAAPVVRVRAKATASGHGGGAPQAVAMAAPQRGHDDHGHGASGGHSPNPMGHDVHWAYGGDTGPESWGRLKPEFQSCMLGKRQSPIDIREGIPVQLDPIQFDYRASAFRVIDNGHTVQVNVEPGNSIVVNGRRYDLLQFHFHRPSEERINGRQYEMVAHLVHKDLDGKLAVVAVLMDQGKAHPLVQQVWNNLPLEKNTEQQGSTMMDLNALLPEQRHYYTYMGSLTTPPCSEGVLWLVMKQPAAISREQIGVFGRLYQMNARPIQPTSGRLIKDGQ